MSFPSPSVTPPTFTQYPSIQFQGPLGNVTFGPAPFYLNDGNLDGIFMPNIRNGDTAAPRTHGSYVGLDLLDVRDVTITIDIGPPFGSYTNLPGAQAALRNALTPSGNLEYPLFLQLSSSSPMLVMMARPRKRGGDVDLAYVIGHLARKIPMQFHATDPTLYAAGTQDPSVGVPAPLGGFSFPMSFNLSFGGGVEYGLITVTNSGDMPCYPIITFTGPCTSPALANASLTGNPYLQFLVGMMNTGDQLIVNTDPKYPSAVYYSNGSTVGSDVMYTLSQGSSWWAIGPMQSNQLQFTTQDTEAVTGSCTVDWTSGYSAAS